MEQRLGFANTDVSELPKEVIVMQEYIVKLSYDNKPFPGWFVGNKDFGALTESQYKVIDFLINNNASPDCIKFEYTDERPAKADFENEFRERFRAKLKSVS